MLRRLSPDPGRQYRSRGMNLANRTVFTGDNLDVLRGMDSGTVDLIYADPPFNSNRTYSAPIGSEAAGAAFKDTWTLDDVDRAWLEIIKDQHPGPHAVIEAAGISHGDGMKSYLCMMAIRLLEIKRVLKPTGSMYLHCDTTASHYLKLLLDSIMGRSLFRNEIIWQRTSPKGLAFTRFASSHDVILCYGGSNAVTWNPPYRPHDPEYVEKFYRHTDSDGRRYTLDNLVNPNRDRPNLTYSFLGVARVWRWTKERMQREYEAGRVIQSEPGRVPRYKRYLDEQKGVLYGDIWVSPRPIQAHAKERIGYPTQKPVALLERIILASSNPGDIVLDPFCGCATALVAAETLTRQWVGIDISPLAVRLVRDRLKREVPLFTQDAIERTDVPIRTDLVDEVREYLNEKRALYGQQEGVCAGCRVHFELRNMEVDHVIPRVKGGPNHISNYQLLCGSCNRRKGAGSQAELIAKLKRDGIIAA